MTCIKNGFCLFKSHRRKEDNSNIEWKDTIPFIPPVDGGKCIKVYDGDTVTIASTIPIKNSPMYRFSVRLNGIDTPEIKGKTKDEKDCAILARDSLSELILHKVIKLRNVKTEKYGRLLADIYIDEIHINEWMINNRYAVKYDGGTKKSPDSWMKYHHNQI